VFGTTVDTDMFIFDALWYVYQNVGLRPFERILMDKNNSFRKYLPNRLAGFKEEDVIEVLGKALKNEEEDIYQTRLIAGLGQTDSKNTIPILQQYVNHENPEVSYLAKLWIAMIERKELPEKPAGLEWGD
jgi:HEAT repeat protein